MWSDLVRESLRQSPVIAVLVIENPADAAPAARALVRGGVRHIELALRTQGSLEAMREIVNAVPEMSVGAGTLLLPEQVQAVKEIGAVFGVSPGLNPAVVQAAGACGLPFAPGVATPSEIEQAYALGCSTLKLFPAEALGGVAYLNSVNAAYRHLGLEYIPLGGVSPENMSEWLAVPEVCAIGGSWIAPTSLIAAQDWNEIERRARAAAERS